MNYKEAIKDLQKYPKVPNVDIKIKNQFRELCKHRTKLKIEEFDKDVVDDFMKIRKLLIDRYGNCDMWVVGSYANGSYIRENTDIAFKKLRNKVKYKTKLSDFDIVVSCSDFRNVINFNNTIIDVVPGKLTDEEHLILN